MKKLITIALLLFVLFPGSVFHDILILLLILFMWRRQLKAWLQPRFKYGYKALWSVMIILTVLLMPRPFALPTDRVRMVHFKDNGERVNAPAWLWAFNLILPEETMCAAASLLPATPARFVIRQMGLGEAILKDYDIELRSGGLLNIGKGYHNNTLALESPMSGVVPQGVNQFFHVKSPRTAYVIRPRNFDADQDYPVLFYAHGYLGNWLLYTGMLRDIDDHIIVCIGTDDLSGIFNRQHIREIKSLYLPMLADMGYKVDSSAISLMGLSNGGSAIDAAYGYRPNDFKNLIYVSTGVNHCGKTSAKIMVIGGGIDHCAHSMKIGMRRLQAVGQNSAFLFDDAHTHLKLLSDMDNCLRFLKEEL